jgi:rhodanese-related sulfurtransferase
MKIILLVVIIGAVAVGAFACSKKNSSSTYQNLNSDEFEKLIADQDIQLLDVRTAEEYAESHLQNSTNIDVLQDSFAQKASEGLKKELPVAVYCKSGRRSRNAADILVKQGYKVYNLDSGIIGWIADGKPVVK